MANLRIKKYTLKSDETGGKDVDFITIEASNKKEWYEISCTKGDQLYEHLLKLYNICQTENKETS